MKVRKDILPHARKNRKKTNAAYTEMMAQYHTEAQGDASKKVNDTMDNIIDIRLGTISIFLFGGAMGAGLCCILYFKHG